jgi:flagellar biosynthesis protein FlhB
MMMMADGDKTEDPTAYRLSKAREDGQVAKSVDLNAAALLGGVLLLLATSGGYMQQLMLQTMEKCFKLQNFLQPMTSTRFMELLTDTLQQLMYLLLPFMGTMMLAALLVNFMQVKALFTVKPLIPNLSKVNPIQGFKRIFSQKAVVELVKGLFKMGIVGSVGFNVIQSHRHTLEGLTFAEPALLLSTVGALVMNLTGWVFVAYLALGLADWRYQAYNHSKQMRMTKQEIKDENKNLEGDQKMRGRIRQAGQRLLQGKQLKHLPTADVVITNPTHYAVALRYDPDIAPAPHVVAIGVDAFALKIKARAQDLGIELVENRPLARALYAQVDYGEMVPPELFVAVAEVLALVYAKKGKR